jgi:hypothetical protein
MTTENQEGPTREGDANQESEVAFQAQVDQDLAKIAELLKASKGYQVTFSTNDGKGGLKHEFLRRNFNRLDMQDSHSYCGELVEKDFEDSRP